MTCADMRWLESIPLYLEGAGGQPVVVPTSDLDGARKIVQITTDEVPEEYWVGGRLYIEVGLKSDFWLNPASAVTLNASRVVFLDKPPLRVPKPR